MTMNLKIKVTFLLTLLFLNGCATQGVKTLAAIDETKSILVVSSMGDDYELMHIGTTIFTNKYKTIDVNDWHLDSAIEEKVSEFVVDDRFKLSSHDLSLIKNDMDKLENGEWSGNIKFKGFDEKIFPYALKENFDMVLFINTFQREDPVYYTGLQVSGYGLYKRSLFGSKSGKYYAISSVSLYDTKTREKVAGTIKSMSIFTPKYDNVKGVESIDYKAISEDKNIMLELILDGIKYQLKDLGIMN